MASPQFVGGILSQLVTKGNTTDWGTAPDLLNQGGATSSSRTFNVSAGPPKDPAGMPLFQLQATFQRKANGGVMTVTYNVHTMVNRLNWGQDVPSTAGSGSISFTMPDDLVAHTVTAYMSPLSLLPSDILTNTIPVTITGQCDTNGIAWDMWNMRGRLVYIPLTQ